MFIDNSTATEIATFGRLVYSEDYLLQNVTLGIRKRNTKDNIVKRSFLDVDVYMKVNHILPNHGKVTVKLSYEFVDSVGIPEEILWNCAYRNMENKFSITPLPVLFNLDYGIPTLHVITTKNGYDGACALLYKEEFAKHCRNINVSYIYIIPSSTEELLLVADNDEIFYKPSELAKLVQEINSSIVDEKIQLSPTIYRFCEDTESISIAARA